MVSQTSGITTPLSRESTSGLTIRQLPLTIRSGLGVLDNPHKPFARRVSIIPFFSAFVSFYRFLSTLQIHFACFAGQRLFLMFFTLKFGAQLTKIDSLAHAHRSTAVQGSILQR